MYGVSDDSVAWGADASGLGRAHKSFRTEEPRPLGGPRGNWGSSQTQFQAERTTTIAPNTIFAEDRRAALRKLEQEAELAARLFRDMRGMASAQAEEVEGLEEALQRTRAQVNAGRVALVRAGMFMSSSTIHTRCFISFLNNF